MKEENKKRINKLIIPFTRRTLAILGAVTISTTGLVSCKKEDKNNSSDLATSTITSSDTELEVSEEILSSSTISTEESSNIDNSQLNSSKADKVSSKPKNDTTKSSSKITNNNDSVQTPSVTTPGPSVQPTMPSVLTAQNINDVGVFKHFAAQFRNDLDGDLLNFGGRLTDGEKEFQLMLALMNYEYINDNTLYQLFNGLSLSQLQELSEFISGIVTTTVYKNEDYNYNKYFINKNLGNFMMEVQNNVLSKNEEKSKEIFNGFYDKTSDKVKYNDNFWVDLNIFTTLPLVIDIDNYKNNDLVQKNAKAVICIDVYNEKIIELYNKISVKVKVKE